MTTLKLICFDLDDTLWPARDTLLKAEIIFYQHLEKSAPALCQRYSAQALRQHRLDLLVRQPKLQHTISEWRKRSLHELLLETGHGDHSTNIVNDAFAIFMQARHAVNLYDDVESTIATLNKRYTLISLTNGNADLHQLPIGQFFAACFRAEQFPRRKPAADLFLAALQHANCRPDEALHIGDHIEDDMAGAKAAGMFTIQAQLTDTAAAQSRHADHSFMHWRELPAAIDKIDSLARNSRK